MIYYLLAVAFMSGLTFTAYGIDKYKAVKQKHRIKEASLLLMAVFLGAAGAIAGSIIFNHKTQKLSFTAINTLSFSAHLLLGLWLYFNG